MTRLTNHQYAIAGNGRADGFGAQIDPREPIMNRETRFWDRIADRYAKKPVADEAAYQEKLKVTRRYLRPDMNVLEFGCGTGSTALVHAPHVRHIHATDISSKMLEIGRSKADAAGISNVSFRQSGIEEFDAPDGTYDVVLGMSILHLLKDPDAAVAKVHRFLKPGGVFVSSTACIGDMSGIFKLILPVGHAIRLTPFVKIFTAEQLKESLQRAGFSIDHEWRPGKGKAVFIVARKPDAS